MRVMIPHRTVSANLAKRTGIVLGAVALALLGVRCGAAPPARDPAVDSGSVSAATASSTRPVPVPAKLEPLPPLADTIAERLVFDPTTQTTFVAAARKGRLLVDLGRVDDNLIKAPERLAAFHLAVAARSPIDTGTTLRVRAPWGSSDATISSFDVYNGRIVGVLRGADGPDSVAFLKDSAVVLAERPGTGAEPTATACDRTWRDEEKARALAVRDSLEHALRDGEAPVYSRLRKSLKIRRSMIRGCFPDGNVLVAVSWYGGDYEWVRERVVLLTSSGAVRVVPVRDLRMRAHDLIDAVDIDDNGIDDVGGRGYTTRGGAHVVLRWTENRLERVAAGFAWER